MARASKLVPVLHEWAILGHTNNLWALWEVVARLSSDVVLSGDLLRCVDRVIRGGIVEVSLSDVAHVDTAAAWGLLRVAHLALSALFCALVPREAVASKLIPILASAEALKLVLDPWALIELGLGSDLGADGAVDVLHRSPAWEGDCKILLSDASAWIVWVGQFANFAPWIDSAISLLRIG